MIAAGIRKTKVSSEVPKYWRCRPLPKPPSRSAERNERQMDVHEREGEGRFDVFVCEKLSTGIRMTRSNEARNDRGGFEEDSFNSVDSLVQSFQSPLSFIRYVFRAPHLGLIEDHCYVIQATLTVDRCICPNLRALKRN